MFLGPLRGQVEILGSCNLEEGRLLAAAHTLLQAAPPPLQAGGEPPSWNHRRQGQCRGWAVREEADNVWLARIRLLVDIETSLAGQVCKHVPLLSPHPWSHVLVNDSLLVRNLVPPKSVLVAAGEAGDDDGDGQGEDEDAREGAETTNQLS